MPARHQDKSAERVETRYRGRTIRIERERRGARGAGDAPVNGRLFIDDVEIDVEETESGVTSHASMFKEYGSLEELAEDLIRQRGTRDFVAGHPHGDHGGGHDHDHAAGDHDHDGNADHTHEAEGPPKQTARRRGSRRS